MQSDSGNPTALLIHEHAPWSSYAESVRTSGRMLHLVSFALLLLACVDDGSFGHIATIAWLVSLFTIAFRNAGAALGLYVASLAVFSTRHFQNWGSVFERPDNYAALMVIAGLACVGWKKATTPALRRLTAIVVLFIAYGLLQMSFLGIATRINFSVFMRSYGIPWLVLLLAFRARPSLNEVKRFADVMIALGVYMAIVSLLETAGWYSVIIPSWISDPALNVTIGIGRAGGLLMQSEWNGAVLGVIWCIVLGSMYFGTVRARALRGLAALLCLVAIYLTYTRGAWLGVAVAFLILVRTLIHKAHDKRMIIAAFVVGASVVAGLVLMPSRHAIERLQDSDNVYFRLNLWAAGLKMAANKPFLGYGAGQFAKQMTSYHEQVSSIPYTPIDAEGTAAHNTFMNILTEEGGIGLVLYFIFIVTLYHHMRRSAFHLWGNNGRSWIAAIWALYFVNMQFIAAYEPTTNVAFFGTMGLIAGLDGATYRHKPAILATRASLTRGAARTAVKTCAE